MLDTPREHLPKNYPLPPDEESEKFAAIWDRAFEIHRKSHDFSEKHVVEGNKRVYKFSRDSMLPVEGSKGGWNAYCDCYERAYQEIMYAVMSTRDIFFRTNHNIDFTSTPKIRTLRLED